LGEVGELRIIGYNTTILAPLRIYAIDRRIG
jgi:hypothetical protein